jgi:hypothetical protein
VDKGLCLPEILEAVLITRIINGEEVRIDPGAIIGPEMIDLPPWTMGSLFAGIGGFDLGFERAGFKTKWQVEIDPYCRKVLEKHFPP